MFAKILRYWWVRGLVFITPALAMACAPVPETPAAPQASIPARNSSPSLAVQGVSTFTDPLTGCEYLTFYDKAVTPRYELQWGGGGAASVRGCR